jgi:hypothetical protein
VLTPCMREKLTVNHTPPTCVRVTSLGKPF